MRTRLLRVAIAGAIVAALSPLVAASAAPSGTVVIRSVDTTKFPHVKLSVLVNGDKPRTTDFHLRENGAQLPDSKVRVVPLSETAQPVGTVIAIDTSGSMKSRGAIDQARAAAKQYVAAKQANTWIAVITFADKVRVVTDFTQDAGALNAAIDGIAASGETALWDGLVQAARLYDRRSDLQANIVLLSDGNDTVSATNAAAAVSALGSVHSTLFAVAIQSAEFNPSGLEELVQGTGGSLLSTTDPRALSAQFAQVQRALENQYEVVYDSPSPGGALRLDLSVGALTTSAETRAGTVGVVSHPKVIKVNNGLLSGASGRLIVLVLVVAAAGLLAYGLLLVFATGHNDLAGRLKSYGRAPDAAYGDGDGEKTLVESGFMQRAVDVTSRIADDTSVLLKVEQMLEQADVPLRPAEALFLYASGVVVLGLLGLVGAPSLPVGLMFVVLLAVAPIVLLRFKRHRRLAKFEGQLPDTLQLLGGTLRAGYSLLQGFEAIAQEVQEPMARELKRVLAEARLGRALEDALEDAGTRMGCRDFDWAVMAIRIQREVGGNLAELLQTVAETMTQRERLRREIKALTAEGRISALIMGLLPIGLGGMLFVISPEYIGTLFKNTSGWIAVIGSAVLAGSGLVWLNKIIKIEV
jgi:tight adherence protein B